MELGESYLPTTSTLCRNIRELFETVLNQCYQRELGFFTFFFLPTFYYFLMKY